MSTLEKKKGIEQIMKASTLWREKQYVQFPKKAWERKSEKKSIIPKLRNDMRN